MKNRKLWILSVIAALIIGALAGVLIGRGKTVAGGNYSDEMKMAYRTNYEDGGANSVERKGDHINSPYFYNKDIYNAKSGNGLYILPNFKTIQQTILEMHRNI